MKFSWKNIFAFRKVKAEPQSGVRHYYLKDPLFELNVHRAMRIPEFYRGVLYISTQVAKLKFQIKNKRNEIVENSRTKQLLSQRPNPQMTAFTLKTWMISQAILEGNAFCEIERDMLGRPIAIWPLETDAISPWRLPSGELVYQNNFPSKSEYKFISPKDVLHLRNLYTDFCGYGISTLLHACRSLGISDSASRYAINVLTSGGIASGYIMHPGKLSDKAYERMKENFNAKGDDLGHTKILEEGMKFQPNAVSDGLQFLDTRKFSVLEIARFLGVSPSKLFHNEKYVASSVEEANIESAIDTLDSWAKNLEEEIDAKLLSNYPGRYSQFDLYDLFRGNMQSRAEYFKKMLEIGAMSPNEIRQKEGMNPYDGGERYFIPANNLYPQDRIDEHIDAKIKNLEKQNDKSSESGDTEKDVDEEMDSMVRNITNRMTKETNLKYRGF